MAAKRDGVVREKEAEVKRVVDGHDDAVREKFHLERFISIFEGWDPKVCDIHGSNCHKTADAGRMLSRTILLSFSR